MQAGGRSSCGVVAPARRSHSRGVRGFQQRALDLKGRRPVGGTLPTSADTRVFKQETFVCVILTLGSKLSC